MATKDEKSMTERAEEKLRAIRSQPVRLPAPVFEEGSSADYDADGVLVMTLRKQATARDAGPTGDAEAAAR